MNHDSHNHNFGSTAAAPRWRDTAAGRAEYWIHGLIFAPRTEDYEGMREYLGSRKAARIIHEENSEGN